MNSPRKRDYTTSSMLKTVESRQKYLLAVSPWKFYDRDKSGHHMTENRDFKCLTANALKCILTEILKLVKQISPISEATFFLVLLTK